MKEINLECKVEKKQEYGEEKFEYKIEPKNLYLNPMGICCVLGNKYCKQVYYEHECYSYQDLEDAHEWRKECRHVDIVENKNHYYDKIKYIYAENDTRSEAIRIIKVISEFIKSGKDYPLNEVAAWSYPYKNRDTFLYYGYPYFVKDEQKEELDRKEDPNIRIYLNNILIYECGNLVPNFSNIIEEELKRLEHLCTIEDKCEIVTMTDKDIKILQRILETKKDFTKEELEYLKNILVNSETLINKVKREKIKTNFKKI